MWQALRLPSVVRRKAAAPSPPLRRRAINMGVGNQTRIRQLSTASPTQLRRTCAGDERAHRVPAKNPAIPAKDGGGSATGAPGPAAASGTGADPGAATPPTAIADHSFKAQGVSVVLRKSCATTPGFTFALVEAAARDALDKIFNSTCIEAGHRTAIQANLTKNGFDFRAADSAKLQTPGACAESTGFSTPANIATLGSAALQAACGPLGSTVLHEIIHLVRGFAGEQLPRSCEASCYGQPGDPTLCRDTDATGHRNPAPAPAPAPGRAAPKRIAAAL